MPETAAIQTTETVDPTGVARVSDTMAQAFANVSGAIRGTPRNLPDVGAKLRGPIGRLMTVMQNNDSIEQRIAHVVSACARAEDADPTVAGAIHTVSAAQMIGVAEALADAAGTTSKAVAEVASLRDDAFNPGDEAHAKMSSGIETGESAAAGIASAAEAARDSAHMIKGLIEASISTQAMKAVDLDWYMQSYTMDSERAIHKTAFN